jgi:signal transduction histidine kinase
MLSYRLSFLLSCWIALSVLTDLLVQLSWPGVGHAVAYLCLGLVLIARYPMWSHRWFVHATPVSYHLAWLGIGAVVTLLAGFTFHMVLLPLILAAEGQIVLSYANRRIGRLWFVLMSTAAAAIYVITVGDTATFIDVLHLAPLGFAALVGLDLLVHALFPAEQGKTTATSAAQPNPVSAQRYRNYVNRVEALAVDRERARIAREFHDTLGHTLTTLDVQIELMARLPAERSAEIQEAARRSRTLVKNGLADVRRSIRALHPHALDGFSIVEAIESLVDEFKRATNIDIRWRTEGKVTPLSPDLALPIYRAAQEALTNVRRHSGASEVTISLAFTTGSIWLVVEDNGRAQTPQKFGFGLSGIRDRVQELGGHFAAGPRIEGGFRIVVKLNK